MEEGLTSIITGFVSDMTLRWSCRSGDFLIWFRWGNILAAPEHGLGIVDIWGMRDGDFVTITNRIQDLPYWFELHPTEVCNRLAYEMMEKFSKGYLPGDPVDGPNVWRPRAGDRLAWIGNQRPENPSSGNVLAILDFRKSALAIGETNRGQSLEDAIAYGSITTNGLRSEDAVKCHEAVKIVRQMGVPRTLAVDWKLG